MISVLHNAILMGTVFLFGSIGETITEKSGHLNLGIPGIMCAGALGGCCGISVYASLANGNISPVMTVCIGILVAFLFAGALGVLFCFLTVTLRCNQNVSGLAITTFGVGATKFIVSILYNDYKDYLTKASTYFKSLFSFSKDLGAFGELFLSYGILVYIAIICAIVASVLLRKTKVGLHLRAVGENPATADAAGINVSSYRYLVTLIGSGVAGLGGLCYMFDYSGAADLINHTIDAYGWLAIAIVIFTMWKPNLSILGSYLFGFLYQLSSIVSLNGYVIDMMPYLVTIIVLIITSIFGSKNVQPPASLGLNYFREDR